MAARSRVPPLADMVEAIGHIRTVTAGVTLEGFEVDWQRFEVDWQKRWLVERGLEIVSEASRHLDDELKARHPEIPWSKVAGIGNVLRHDYERIVADLLWNLLQDDLLTLETACRNELAARLSDHG
jgi:uncharacterized protein with HEPN domain